MWDTNDEEWDRVMDITTNRVFLRTQSVIPEMKKAGGGTTVDISSI
ncbi:MAG: cyclopentanol dehydrogenase, partial [SAR202 cluster bacterium Ae2-Chloro-G2]